MVSSRWQMAVRSFPSIRRVDSFHAALPPAEITASDAAPPTKYKAGRNLFFHSIPPPFIGVSGTRNLFAGRPSGHSSSIFDAFIGFSL